MGELLFNVILPISLLVSLIVELKRQMDDRIRQQSTPRVCPECRQTFFWAEINHRKLSCGANGLAHFNCPRCEARIAIPFEPRDSAKWKLPEVQQPVLLHHAHAK